MFHSKVKSEIMEVILRNHEAKDLAVMFHIDVDGIIIDAAVAKMRSMDPSYSFEQYMNFTNKLLVKTNGKTKKFPKSVE